MSDLSPNICFDALSVLNSNVQLVEKGKPRDRRGPTIADFSGSIRAPSEKTNIRRQCSSTSQWEGGKSDHFSGLTFVAVGHARSHFLCLPACFDRQHHVSGGWKVV